MKYDARAAAVSLHMAKRQQKTSAVEKQTEKVTSAIARTTEKLIGQVARDFAELSRVPADPRKSLLDAALYEMHMTPAQFAYEAGVNVQEIRDALRFARAGHYDVNAYVWKQINNLLTQRLSLLRAVQQKLEHKLVGSDDKRKAAIIRGGRHG